MARLPPTKESPITGRTLFQIYESERGLIDYTEKRLKYLLEGAKTSKRKTQLTGLLEAYTSRSVAVAWSHGEPIFAHVTKESDGRPKCVEDIL
jgi:hypothetical protein